MRETDIVAQFIQTIFEDLSATQLDDTCEMFREYITESAESNAFSAWPNRAGAYQGNFKFSEYLWLINPYNIPTSKHFSLINLFDLQFIRSLFIKIYRQNTTKKICEMID